MWHIMETNPSQNISTREFFFRMIVSSCVVVVFIAVVCVFSYGMIHGKNSVRLTVVQFDQVKTSCGENGGIHSVIFFRTAVSLGATVRCSDGAFFERNFQGSDSLSTVKPQN